MSLVEWYNVGEACFWIALGGALAFWGPQRWPTERRCLARLSVLLVLFGLSDVVEIRTGAWWRPWWLLLWKGLCLAGILVQSRRLWRAASRPSTGR